MRLSFSITLYIFFLTIPDISFSQIDRERVGNDLLGTQQGGFFNYGDKDKVNIEVNLWGYVKYPGKYLIPSGSSIIDLISYGGGPITEAKLEDIRLFRPRNDSLKIKKDEILKLNYNDLVWEEAIAMKTKSNFIMKPGDVLILTGEPRYFARDNVNFFLSIAAVITSIGILVVSIAK